LENKTHKMKSKKGAKYFITQYSKTKKIEALR
jgi:hypothetical protein